MGSDDGIMNNFHWSFCGLCWPHKKIYNYGKDKHTNHIRQVLDVMRHKKFYDNLKRCSFMSNELVLNFITRLKAI